MFRYSALLFLVTLTACSHISDASRDVASESEPWLEAHSFRPIFTTDSKTDPEVRGVWQSRGYGRILEIDDSNIVQYEIGDTCYKPERAGNSLSAMDSVGYRYYGMLQGKRSSVFQLLRGDTNVMFDKLDRLPASCLDKTTTNPSIVSEAFLDIFERHYAFFANRLPGHQVRAARVREQITYDMTDAELWKTLASYMEGLSDSHTKLIGMIDGEKRKVQDGLGNTLPMVRASEGGESAWLVGLINQTMKALGDTARHTGRDRIIWGLLGDKIGYLQIFQMGGFTDRKDFGSDQWAEAELDEFNRIMDAAFSTFQGAQVEAVILDLSNNRGGWDQIAKAIPGRFTDRAYIGYTTVAKGSGLTPFPHMIHPSKGPRFAGPVYVVTSDVTVSGGELATLALRQNPQVLQVGQTTRGAFSTPLAKRLPNGWLLEVSNEIFAAPDGDVFEEIGLDPALEIDIFPAEAPVEGHSRAISSIVELMSSK